MFNPANLSYYWPYWLAVGCFIAFVIMMLNSLFENLKTARSLEDTPTSSIRSASQGMVQLEGHVRAIAKTNLLAPLTQQACCWYSYRIEEAQKRQVGNKIERYWQTIKEEASSDLFILNDTTGDCLICPIGACVQAKHIKTWQSPYLPAHFAKKPSLLERLFGARRYFRFYEAAIYSGDPLCALGFFETLPVDKSLSEQLTSSLESLSSRKKQSGSEEPAPGLKQGFFPGVIPFLQLENQYKHYQQAYQSNHPVHLLSANALLDQPYLLSSVPKAQLARRYKWKAIGYLLLFIICLIPFWMIINRY